MSDCCPLSLRQDQMSVCCFLTLRPDHNYVPVPVCCSFVSFCCSLTLHQNQNNVPICLPLTLRQESPCLSHLQQSPLGGSDPDFVPPICPCSVKERKGPDNSSAPKRSWPCRWNVCANLGFDPRTVRGGRGDREGRGCVCVYVCDKFSTWWQRRCVVCRAGGNCVLRLVEICAGGWPIHNFHLETCCGFSSSSSFFARKCERTTVSKIDLLSSPMY